MWPSFRQASAIFKKNLKRSLTDKKKLLTHFLFPLIICLIYHTSKSTPSPDLRSITVLPPLPQPNLHNLKLPPDNIHWPDNKLNPKINNHPFHKLT